MLNKSYVISALLMTSALCAMDGTSSSNSMEVSSLTAQDKERIQRSQNQINPIANPALIARDEDEEDFLPPLAHTITASMQEQVECPLPVIMGSALAGCTGGMASIYFISAHNPGLGIPLFLLSACCCGPLCINGDKRN